MFLGSFTYKLVNLFFFSLIFGMVDSSPLPWKSLFPAMSAKGLFGNPVELSCDKSQAKPRCQS